MTRKIISLLSHLPPTIFILIFTIIGISILSTFTTIQKIAIGIPLSLPGYIVPTLFGGISGAIIGYLFNHLEQSRRRAILLSDLKGKYLANISHEVRTPLNGIVGLVDIIEPGMDPQNFHHLKKIILNSTDNLVKILNDILDFSRIEMNQMYLKSICVPLISIINEPAALLSAMAARKKISMLTHTDPGLDYQVITDAVKLKQIMINLINNAIKFTEYGTIKISLINLTDMKKFSDSLHVRFIVEDTGIGIPAEKINLIFTPFFQLSETQTTRHHGAGLGLTIAANLIKLFNSQIKVKSTVNLGSCFHFELLLKICDKD